MDIIQIGSVGLIAVILIMSIKNQMPQFSLMISIMTGVLIFIMIMPKLSVALNIFNELGSKIEIEESYIGTVLKIIGIAYIAEFCSQICIDSGESSIASKIELGGKVLIMITSMPIILGMTDIIVNILS